MCLEEHLLGQRQEPRAGALFSKEQTATMSIPLMFSQDRGSKKQTPSWFVHSLKLSRRKPKFGNSMHSSLPRCELVSWQKFLSWVWNIFENQILLTLT